MGSSTERSQLGAFDKRARQRPMNQRSVDRSRGRMNDIHQYPRLVTDSVVVTKFFVLPSPYVLARGLSAQVQGSRWYVQIPSGKGGVVDLENCVLEWLPTIPVTVSVQLCSSITELATKVLPGSPVCFTLARHFTFPAGPQTNP